MSSTFYFGETSGARVLAYGDATSQVGTDFQWKVRTWDAIPMGEVGDVYFRSIDVSLIAASGYDIGITPIVDGIALTEQLFNGANSGEVEIQAFFATRGTRCAAEVRSITRSGDVTLHNVGVSFVPIRRTP